MNKMGKWVVLIPALCILVALVAAHADAQRHEERREGREFIGTYARTKPARRGQVHYLLSLRRGGQAVETVAHPNGTTATLDGTWEAHEHQIHVALSGRDRDASGPRTFRLDGRNLVLLSQPGIFYKKQ